MAKWTSLAARDLPLNSERSWDASGARSRVFALLSDARKRRAFLAFDEAAPDDPASFQLQFCDVIDGALTAVASGLRTAAASLPVLEGLTEEVRNSARSVIDSYLDRMHDDRASDEQRAAGGMLLARLSLDTRASSRQPKSKEDLPEELLAQIHDTSILESGLPYLNKAWGSTDQIDTYFTRMLPTSLRNFAEDASAGIAIQNSHRVDEQSLGRTYRGTYKAPRNGAIGRTEMDFYLPPNIAVNGTLTSDIINGIRWGTVKDVSVGFYGGEIRCSMCEKPMFQDLYNLMFFGGDDDDQESRDPNAPCHHIPGIEYAGRDKQGKKTGERAVAIGDIDDAHCAELSFVFDGATPQAQIKGRQAPALAKAIRMAEMEVLPRRPAMALETRYRGQPSLAAVTVRRFAGYKAVEDLDLPASPAPAESEEAASAGGVASSPPPPERSAPQPQFVPQEGEPMPDPSDLATTDTSVEAPPAEAAPASGPSGGPATPGQANPASSPAASDVQMRAAMVSAGLAPDGFQGDLAVRFRELATELADLREWADVGRQARTRLVDECKKAGTRAFGKQGLPEAAYGDLLTRGSYKALEGLHAHLTEIGNNRFPSGRATDDGDPSVPAPEPVKVPARAFRS